MPYYALLYRAIVALLINVLATSTLAEEIDEATKKRLSKLILDFSKISIVFLPTFPEAPIIAKFILNYFISILQ